MNTEKVRIFKSNLFILISLALVPVMGGGAFVFPQNKPAGILIFLTGLLGLTYFLLLCPISIAFSSDGISQRSLLRSWYVNWGDVTRWNLVDLGLKKRTIWFSTGANLYKISPDFFWRNDIAILKAYFEKYCGNQAAGSSRLQAKIINFLR